MSDSPNCIFCKIVAGAIPAEKVVETDEILIFKDIHPKAPVHALAIPKKHIVETSDMSSHGSALFGAIAEAAQKLGISSSGYRIVMNRGADAGQEVDHLHFHILAGRKLGWPPG